MYATTYAIDNDIHSEWHDNIITTNDCVVTTL